MSPASLKERLLRLVGPVLFPPDQLQVAALCLRRKGRRCDVLLVTSRGTGRWILPKGWPMKGRSLSETAAAEAWEEGGVTGDIHPESVGRYSARRVTEAGLGMRCEVHVFRLDVENIEDSFPEAGQRRRRWVSLSRAAKMVQEPSLSALLRSLKDTSPTVTG